MVGIRLQEKIQGVLKSALHKTAGIREVLTEINSLEGVSTLDEYIERIGWRAKGVNIGIAVVVAFVISFIIATEKSFSVSDKLTSVRLTIKPLNL